MSFFSRIFGSEKDEEEVVPVKTTIKFSELDSWFSRETECFLNPIKQSMKTSFDDMRTVSEELNASIMSLESAKIEQETELRVKQFAVNNREALIKKIRTFKSKIQFPDAENILDATKFHGTFGFELNNIVRDTAKNIHFTNMLFPEEVKELNTSMRRLGFFFGKSQKMLDGDKKKIGSIFDAEEKIQEIKNLIDSRESDKKKMLQSESELKKMQATEKKIKEELSSMIESSELATLKQACGQKKDIENKCSFIEADILQIFSPLGKAMKKYERYSTGLDKNETGILALYMDAPFSALLADREQKILGKILENMEMLINAGRIDFKGKQKEKVISQIGILKKGTGLESAIAEYETLRKKTEEIEMQIKCEKISEKINLKKNAILDIENRAMDEKNKIQKLKNSIDESMHDVSKKIKGLEPVLSRISGKDVSVEFLN